MGCREAIRELISPPPASQSRVLREALMNAAKLLKVQRIRQPSAARYFSRHMLSADGQATTHSLVRHTGRRSHVVAQME